MNKKGLSQAELHRKSGVSQSQISDIISGEKSPTLRTMEKLAVALGVTVGQLIGEELKSKSKAG